jgi:alkylhydroperoxidase/carboxymuconolactone decarboxylase family protein YurZ
MRGALRTGANPREIMEICMQTAMNFGMPPMLKALEVFVEVMAEEKRLDEIGNPPLRVESYGK